MSDFPLDAVRDAIAWLGLPGEVGEAAQRFANDERRLCQWRALYDHWIAAGPQHIEAARQWSVPADAEGLMLYAMLCLSGVVRGRTMLEDRGLPTGVVRASFEDVPRRLRRCRDARGCWGIEKPRWLGRHLHGRLVELGRLQFEVGVMADRADAAHAPVLSAHGLALDMPVWWVHIPAGEALSAETCEASFAQARALLPRHFADHPAAWFACRTWLFDGQLRDYLPAASNLLRFAARFTVVDEWDDDGEFRQFVREGPRGGKPTRLQLADAEHQRRGKSWRVGLGVMQC